MTKLITYLSIAVVLGLSRFFIKTPWLLITAPIWAPIFTAAIDKIIHTIKLRKNDERSYY